MIKTENDSRINNSLHLCLNEESQSLKEKPTIAKEILQNVYFKTSSETSADCLKRICSLISSSQKKLLDYQSRHKCPIRWGPPISINRQMKESLLKGAVRNNRSYIQFRRPRTVATLPSADQYDFNSDSDSDNNIASRNDSDEDWNIFQEKTRIKKVGKRKAPLSITRTQQLSCPKQKKIRANIENLSPIKIQHLPNDLAEQVIQEDIKQVIEANIVERNHNEDTDKANKSLSISSTSDSIKLQNKTTSFRKSFQLQCNLAGDPNKSFYDNSSCEISDEITSLKRPIMESTNITTRDRVKKKKLSGNIDPNKSLPGSQDLFANENELSAADENEPESSREKSQDNVPLENHDEILKEDQIDKNDATSTDKLDLAADDSEVSIIEDVQCPICSHYFHRKEIEGHASDCDGLPTPPIPDDIDATLGRKLRNSSKR